MLSARVVNIRKLGPGEMLDIYVGRPSPWGNPFRLGPDCTRKEVLAKFRVLVDSQPAFKEEIARGRGRVRG